MADVKVVMERCKAGVVQVYVQVLTGVGQVCVQVLTGVCVEV